MELLGCWGLPFRHEHLVEYMRLVPNTRVHLPWHEDGFDASRPIYANGGRDLDDTLHDCWTYRQGLYLCPDAWGPLDNPNRYHMDYPMWDPVTSRNYWRREFEYIATWTAPNGTIPYDVTPRSGPTEIKAIEAGNENGYLPFLLRDVNWPTLKGWFEKYLVWFRVIQELAGEFWPDVPVIVGGDNPRWWRNRDGRHPSLARWMADEQGAEHVSWHPSSNWTPDEIGRATGGLSYWAATHITEDVYRYTPDADRRGVAAEEYGAETYAVWPQWGGQAGEAFYDWRPGCQGGHCIPFEVDGRRVDARAEEIRRLSMATGNYRPDAQPRGMDGPVDPPTPPPPEYEPGTNHSLFYFDKLAALYESSPDFVNDDRAKRQMSDWLRTIRDHDR